MSETNSEAEGLLARMPPAPRAPTATYRVQLHKDFTFRDAARIVPYLSELGIGALYASPYWKAAPGSTHGYNVVDFSQLNPEIGSEADFENLVTTVQAHDLGLLVDFVPNHMGIGAAANPWWQDVLENGRSSAFASFFDIDWEPTQAAARGKVVLPFLGEHYGVVLERGELQLRFADGAFTVCYYELPLPIAPPTYPLILQRALSIIEAELAADDPALLEFQSIVTAFARLPGQDEQEPERVAERRREQVIAKRRLSDVGRVSPVIAAALDQVVTELNGIPGAPRTFDALDELLEAQSYRPAFWRVAAEEINYRRFFAINELAAIRQESPALFDATHELLLRQIGDGIVTGVRLDHPDGLWDPAGYARDLQRAAFLARSRSVAGQSGEASADAASLADTWETHPAQRFYIVVEKILEPGEQLPADWPVAGTVGYEFARATTGLFVDAANRKAFDDLYTRFIGDEIVFSDLVYAKKQLMMRVALASEVNVLTDALNRISEQDRHTRDFTWGNLRFALREIIACFPIYRTYAVCERGGVRGQDRRAIERAATLARRRNPASEPTVFDFVRDLLLLRGMENLTEEQRQERCRFGMKVQQLTGPVMAKGLEDTALYIDNRLVALNEVGGDPTAFGVPVDEFHRLNQERQSRWPGGLLASSTHDTKRSEDVRARIAVLSEMPRDWRAALNRWRRMNRKQKRRIEGSAAPSANDEYLYYQTLLGTWPIGDEMPTDDYVARMTAYAIKAAREAQVSTSWVNVDEAYESALTDFIGATLDPSVSAAFLDDLADLRHKVTEVGMFNSLSQQLLKLTSPGVPDLYQGTELWDFSLVDPDNRRPVDYRLRTKLFGDMKRRRPSRRLAEDLVVRRADGRIKQYLTSQVLRFRRAHPDLFAEGEYLPLAATGSQSNHVVAFARRFGDQAIVVVTPRLIAGLTRGDGAPLGEIWGETRLSLVPAIAGRRLRNLFSSEIVTTADGSPRLADVLATFPVSVLELLPDAE